MNFKVKFSRLILKDSQPDASRSSANSAIHNSRKSRGLPLQLRDSWTLTTEKLWMKYVEDSEGIAKRGRFGELVHLEVELDGLIL